MQRGSGSAGTDATDSWSRTTCTCTRWTRTILGRIRGEDEDYPEKTIEWLTSHEFREANQNTYIERSRMIAVPVDGDDRLQESYERLVDEGLIEEIEDLKLYWSKAEGSLHNMYTGLTEILGNRTQSSSAVPVPMIC